MVTELSDNEILDLVIFLEYADVDYCDICGWSINVRTYGRRRICRHCIEKLISKDKVHTCSICGEVLLEEDIVKFEENGYIYYYCDSCARNEIVPCYACGQMMRRRGATRVYDDYGVSHLMCNTCASDYPVCTYCGNRFMSESHDGMCSQCYNRTHWKGEGKRYCYHEWDEDHKWNFYHEDGSVSIYPKNNTIYLGTETEIDTDDDGYVQEVCGRLNRKLGGLVHYERDGSLGNSGIEIISMPMVLSKHMEFKDKFESGFLCALDNDYWCDDSTGLHVHVSTTVLEVKHHKRLLYMLNKFRQNVVNLSRRISDYAVYYSISHILGHDYDEGWVPTGRDLTEYLGWIRDHSGHGIYINYNAYPDSIEFRMFGGTLDIVEYIGTIQFVHRCIEAVLEYTLNRLRELSFDEIFKGKYVELDELIDRTKDLNIRVRR